ncbi:MAG: DUF3572 family protein [Hyphomicrobiales bacterium]|nr:DUF3572 family protein [Hyphomicrobiales bacterium]
MLATLADSPESLERFLALSGLDAGHLRAASQDPAFLQGVVDYAVKDEALLREMAARAGMAPERLAGELMHIGAPQGEALEEHDVWIDP